MQQIAVNQMNGTSGGSLRQKLDLSDACQATDAFAMLFMQLMGQTIQPEALLQMQGEQPLAQTDAVLPAAAGTVGSMASGNEMQAMLADLIQNAGSTPAEGAFLQTFAMQSMDTVPGTAAAEGTVQGAELLEGDAEDMQQLYTVLKAAWGGEESSGLMENGFSSLQAGNDGVHQAERADSGRSGNAGSGQSAASEHPAAAAVIASKHQVKKRSFGSSFLFGKDQKNGCLFYMLVEYMNVSFLEGG